MNAAGRLLRLLQDKSRVVPYVATFVSFDGAQVTLDAGGGRFPAKTATSYRPQVNESVWVQSIDDKPYMIGPSVTKPGSGQIVSSSGGLATVSTDIGTVIASYSSGMTLSAGQVVKLYWNDGPHVIGVMAATPPAPTAPGSPTPPATSNRVDVFTALDAGTYDTTDGWWTGQVRADTNDLGAWFYGTKIADTLQGAPVTAIQIYVAAASISGTPNFSYHAHPTRPAGTPTLTGSTPVTVADGQWVDLPAAYGQALAGGPGGIGVNHGGPSVFRSLNDDPQSGALRISSNY